MAIEIFNRYENKYRITADTYEKLRIRFSDYMEADNYCPDGAFYSICSVYYDTEDNHLIRASLDGPVYKEKLRLRSYGTAQPDSTVFLEIKKKYNGFTNKRRSCISLAGAEHFLRTSQMPDIKEGMNTQVLHEVDYLLSHKALLPAVYLSYERVAYTGIEEKDLRISFDRNILTRRSDLSLSSPIYGEPLLEEEMRLMEIKVRNTIPLWLTKLLSEYKIYPTSFSKYGAEYKKQLAPGKQNQKVYIFLPSENLSKGCVTHV